jgi:ribosomal protein S12
MLKINKIHVALAKVIIRKKTLKMGFFEKIIKIEGHNLQQHSSILIQGAKVRDLIAVSFSAIRGKYDFLGVAGRKTRRSLFGVKRISN